MICLGVSYKTKIVAIHSNNSKLLIISRYQNPKAKVYLEINTNKIDDMKIATLFFPFAYQDTKARNGDIIVIVTQIIIYDLGKNQPSLQCKYNNSQQFL